MDRADENVMSELHNLLTLEYLNRIKNGEASAQELKGAADWLSKNNITGVAAEGSPLSALSAQLPELDFSDVEGYINGR